LRVLAERRSWQISRWVLQLPRWQASRRCSSPVTEGSLRRRFRAASVRLNVILLRRPLLCRARSAAGAARAAVVTHVAHRRFIDDRVVHDDGFVPTPGRVLDLLKQGRPFSERTCRTNPQPILPPSPNRWLIAVRAPRHSGALRAFTPCPSMS
jgi:hypothetical protein